MEHTHDALHTSKSETITTTSTHMHRYRPNLALIELTDHTHWIGPLLTAPPSAHRSLHRLTASVHRLTAAVGSLPLLTASACAASDPLDATAHCTTGCCVVRPFTVRSSASDAARLVVSPSRTGLGIAQTAVGWAGLGVNWL